MAVAPHSAEHSPTAPPHIKREQTLDKKGAYHQFSGGCHPISHPKNDPSLSMECLSQPFDSFSNLGIPSTSPGPPPLGSLSDSPPPAMGAVLLSVPPPPVLPGTSTSNSSFVLHLFPPRAGEPLRDTSVYTISGFGTRPGTK